MNAAHWHLVLVHLPIVLTPFAALLLSIALLRNHASLTRLSFLILVICGIATAAAYVTGDGAEEEVEHVSGVSETTIEDHEEAAEVALWLCVLSGLVSAFALARGSRRWVKGVGVAALFVSWAASSGLAYTGYLGGKIRHPEAYAASQLQTGGEEDDDD